MNFQRGTRAGTACRAASLGLDPDGTVIHTIPFNFRSEYGLSTSGNQLYNLITEEQKVRVREVFDLFSRYAGVRFVETANDGIAVVLGDTTVISDNSPTESVDGLARGSVNAGIPTADAMAIISSFRVWGKSEYGGSKYDFFWASTCNELLNILYIECNLLIIITLSRNYDHVPSLFLWNSSLLGGSLALNYTKPILY